MKGLTPIISMAAPPTFRRSGSSSPNILLETLITYDSTFNFTWRRPQRRCAAWLASHGHDSAKNAARAPVGINARLAE